MLKKIKRKNPPIQKYVEEDQILDDEPILTVNL